MKIKQETQHKHALHTHTVRHATCVTCCHIPSIYSYTAKVTLTKLWTATCIFVFNHFSVQLHIQMIKILHLKQLFKKCKINNKLDIIIIIILFYKLLWQSHYFHLQRVKKTNCQWHKTHMYITQMASSNSKGSLQYDQDKPAGCW